MKCQNRRKTTSNYRRNNFIRSVNYTHFKLDRNNNMIFVIRRLFVTQQNACILNRVFNPSKPISNCVRQLHILQNKKLPMTGCCHLDALQAAYNCNRVVHTPIRFKSNKKNRKLNRNHKGDEDDEDDKDDSDDERSNLDEFRQGDSSSDRNLTEIKVQTLRLDTVIKAGLGFSKKYGLATINPFNPFASISQL